MFKAYRQRGKKTVDFSSVQELSFDEVVGLFTTTKKLN